MFQSTHPRRVRLTVLMALPLARLFQSTHPRRVRPVKVTDICLTVKFQSTHPRRVRRRISGKLCAINLFQSTHPRRVRLIKLLMLMSFWSFNPRTHVGCDGLTRSSGTDAESFNPRTHVGCDHVQKVRYMSMIVSIHAPT